MNRIGQDSIKLIEMRQQLIIDSLQNFTNSVQSLLNLISHIQYLLSHEDKNLHEAYINEIIDDFKTLLKKYHPFGISPEVTRSIISTGEELTKLNFIRSDKSIIDSLLNDILNRLNDLEMVLEGNQQEVFVNQIYFPVLEQSDSEKSNTFGFLESASIHIRKSENKTTFRLIPGEINKDNLIEQQLVTSWDLALKKVKPFIKKAEKHHEVFIHFDNARGFYRGNSLGSALTLLFIDGLLIFYNSPTSITTNGRIAFTGGLDSEGRVLNTSEHIIKKKVELTFYSDAQVICLSKNEEAAANEELCKLKEKYPKRELKIIGVESLNDILDRRTIVSIKKLNPIKRTGKFVMRNRAGIVTAMLLTAFLTYLFALDFDDNPATVEYENQYLKIKNANNKTLWSDKVGDIASFLLDGSVIRKEAALIYDINNDGVNETIITNICYLGISLSKMENEIVCLNKNKKPEWSFKFNIPVSSRDITFPAVYRFLLIGVYEINQKKLLFVIARNDYYPSAVFALDVTSGKQLGDIFWHSGHLVNGFVIKNDSTGKNSIILAGINNGFEAVAVMSLNVDNLNGQAVAPENYKLNNISPAIIDRYILIPQSDYSRYYNNRYNRVPLRYTRYLANDKLIIISTCENGNLVPDEPHVHYYFNSDLSLNIIESADQFQHNRDKLVISGELQPPLTYTPEYFEILKKNIRYWNGKEFVKK